MVSPAASAPAPAGIPAGPSNNEPALAAGERRSEMNKCNWPRPPNEVPEENSSGRYSAPSLEI